MENKSIPENGLDISKKVARISALLLAVITLATFGFAVIAIPVSGANCTADCVSYPYLDTLAQYPRDFIWMVLALFMLLAYLVLMVALDHNTTAPRKIFSRIGLRLAVMATLVLMTDYYLQVSIIPMSLLNAEIDGLPLLIQYNPHGVFLIMEELGYLLMSLSFLFYGLTFTGASRLEKSIRRVFMGSFAITVLTLLVITGMYGLARLDRLEVIILSVDWLALILNGFLLARYYRN